MPGINRRDFLAGALSAGGAMMLAPYVTACSSKQGEGSKKPVSSFDMMKEVMKYRKIDSHAHVYFSPDSPGTQLDFADRLGIEKLVISRPMTPGSEGRPDEFIRCNDLILSAVKQHPDRFIVVPFIII